MNILITQHRLKNRGGTEFYVFELAQRLLQLGHRVVVYCPHMGDFARRFADATIAVVDDLGGLKIVPDIIHGQHGLETLTAMIRFPETPAVYVLHDWAWKIDTPPILDRIRKYVAVDATCLDRLLIRENAPFERCSIIQNGVNLPRFQLKTTRSVSPRRAIVFSNYIPPTTFAKFDSACRSLGIVLDSMGDRMNTGSDQPEQILADYDLVFARGRCAREALAVGCSVIVTGHEKMGEIVTEKNVKWSSQLNFGRRLLVHEQSKLGIADQIKRYNIEDSLSATRYIRENCSLQATVDELIAVYRQAIEEFQADACHRSAGSNHRNEAGAIASYLGWYARQSEPASGKAAVRDARHAA